MLVFLGFINMMKTCGGMNPPTVFFDLPALRRRFKTAFGG